MSKIYGTDSSLHHYIHAINPHGIAGWLKEARNLLSGKPTAANAVASHAQSSQCMFDPW